jgi:hypothetical protein
MQRHGTLPRARLRQAYSYPSGRPSQAPLSAP